MKSLKTASYALGALLSLSAILNPVSASARSFTRLADDDTIEIGFSMKLFGGAAGKEPLAIAQGVSDLAFEVLINSPIGPMKCAMGTQAVGATSALAKLADPATVAATQFDFNVTATDQIVCQTDEDRKIQITYRIPKAAAENTVTQQIDQTLLSLKSGGLTDGFTNDILNNVLKDSLHTMTIHLARSQPISLGDKMPSGVPMVAFISADPATVSGAKISASGKDNTANAKNIYPNLNRFALVCGFADETTGQIDQPMLPSADASVSSFVKTSNGKPFGCIANNSPDGFDMFDTYSAEDPTYNLHFLIISQADLQKGLEKLRDRAAQAADVSHVSKLEALANSIVDGNKKRVQAEVDKRRVAALVKAGYLAEIPVTLHAQAFYLSLSGKPRYGQDPASGQLRMDTVFDVQGERSTYSFSWIDKSKFSFSQDSSWVGLSAPLTTSDYDDQLSHFDHEYRICGSRGASVKAYLNQLAKTKNFSTKALFALLSKENAAACTDSAEGEKRVLKYARYEGSCFIETPYSPKDGAPQLVRYKPTNYSVVYADETGGATAKVKVDLAKLTENAALFSGLDVVTTLPYDAARANTYKINCNGAGAFPADKFKPADVEAQKDVPGFSHLTNPNQSSTPVNKDQK